MASERHLTGLEEKDKVRKKPEVMFGTRDITGAANGIYEVVANAVDEAREGHGNVIDFTISADNVVEVNDRGRGLPMGWNPVAKRYDWEFALCQLYASGKYDNEQYGNALGSNGLGLAAMQFASEFMDVESIYDGNRYEIHFKKGDPVSKLLKSPADPNGKKSGTRIRFKPDEEVFMGINEERLPMEFFIDLMRKQAMNLPGLQFNFTHPDENGEMQTLKIVFKNGIKEFVEKVAAKGCIAPDTGYFTDEANGEDEPGKHYNLKMQIAFSFSDTFGALEVYHNSSQMTSTDKNYTQDALKTAAVNVFTDYAREQKAIGKADRFLYRDIEPNLVCVGTTDSPGYLTWYEHQTKDGVINPFIKKAFGGFCYRSFMSWLKNSKSTPAILQQVITNKKAREEADRVSRNVISKLNKSANSMGSRVDDFCDCTSDNPSETEIYIVEGLSAFGAAKKARSPKTQAVLALKGKPLNCQKASIFDIVQDEVILRIARAFGCGLEINLPGKKIPEQLRELPKFDIHKMRYGKVVICTDGDVDGSHIRTLMLTLLYRLFPSLIKYGMVYIVESPLYEFVVKGADRSYFAYSDAERDKYIERLDSNGFKYKIQRSKGLGENDSDMMSYTTMAPETRKLVRVEYVKDEELLAATFERLLGDDLKSRKAIIEQYFSKYENIGD